MKRRTYIIAATLCVACNPGDGNPFDAAGNSSGGTASTTGGQGPGGSTVADGPGDPDTTVGNADGTQDSDEGGIFDVGGGVDLGLPPGSIPECGDLAKDEATSVGCEFWAVRVPLFSNPLAPATYGIGVGNPFDQEVTVVIEDMRGAGGVLREVHQLVLGPKQSELLTLEGPGGILPTENHTAAGVGITQNAAFRITSDGPMTAMQIAPVGGAPSFMPEASMLLPKRALNDVYYGIGYEAYTIPFPIPGFAGWVVVTAVEDNTTVTTVDGEQILDAFDTWTYAPDDPTGFFVSADKRIAVFGGTNCSNIPGDNGWCDHVEEQLIPVAAWGTRYVGARHPQRSATTPEDVYWRLVAGQDDTDVTLTPGTVVHLASAGDYYDFATPENFLAESDEEHPFMLVQFMGGGEALYPGEECFADAAATGDPYMMQMVPTDQWLDQLPFLTDGSYQRDFVTIVRPAGTSVTLECMGQIPNDRFDLIPGTDFEVANIFLDIDGAGGEANCVDGQQFITAEEPVGVSVGGYDCAASYGYPGGMSLDALWIPPDVPPAG
ncbi:MAG: IgGFc-binding protein [Myxococcota bacterium]